ncbi:hypothetical protein [Streptomyces beijiangensis]|uniref:hypothetical protein n=1 Tax=Streptomyces beijiangensis TaxID=163361 RepID=UPI0031E202FA
MSAGRERLRAAEDGFEQALRPPALLEGANLVVHGNVVFPQPGADSPRDEDEQEEPSSQNGRRVITDASAPRDTRLTLSHLWAVNHGRLDLYHEIALGQASRSFRNAQAAMVLGFVLLVAFVIVALRADTTAGSVVAGGLGAVAAGLAAYVSRTFIRSQETAAGHLRAYFDQPLEFSRYLAAERLIADSGLSEEQRATALTVLVEVMVGRGEQGRPGGNGNADPAE